MNRLLFLVLVFFSSLSIADENNTNHAPRAFAHRDGNAVFVDFTRAHYEITYDIDAKSARVLAEITFLSNEEGYPVFDSVASPDSVMLDGARTVSREIRTPDQATTLRVLDQKAGKGEHLLRIELPLTELVDFRSGGVRSAFWTSDLDERNFLERYVPANFEFDQVKMDFLVRFKGLSKPQSIYTNGSVLRLDQETFQIAFPAHFTASSLFFHTVPEGVMNESRFSLKSSDGRVIPVLLYAQKDSWSAQLERLGERVRTVFRELEADYGPFPHPSILVYQAGAGGMEYCGATMTDFGSLGHELFHSYFARGVMPANGNSGWLDEALASWRDNGYPTLNALSGSSGMSSHPNYTRITDTAAYSFGARFMGFLDGETRGKGGMKPFMRELVATRILKPMFVEEFIEWMEDFYQQSFQDTFKRYTYKSRLPFEGTSSSLQTESHPHRKMSLKELRAHL
ncbi:MAG: hypothetical protein KGP28_10720 [Bdellovibrionales bacterium]|nr:hypothetical protein [Bdellovibrionales bacterium]